MASWALAPSGCRVIPMGAGERLTPGAEDEIRQQRIAILQDGSISFWEDTLEAWAGNL